MLEFCDFDEVFLKKSWNWLNDPDIKAPTRTSDFTKEEQEEWFITRRNSTDYKIWGVKYMGEPIGCFGIKNLQKDSGEFWCYIGEKDLWGKGLGSLIMIEAKQKARECGINTLYLNVLDKNERAIRLYTKHKFGIENKKDDLICMKCNLEK
jgi:RimJ/RimL family protein N-acetyltransferase